MSNTPIDQALTTLLECNLEELDWTQSRQLVKIVDYLSDEWKSWLHERVCWPDDM